MEDYETVKVGLLDFDQINQIILFLAHHLAVFLLNLISYAYIIAKFFKVLCYSKITFEWFPMINPYVWPFSIFHILTGPYFAFWSRVLPILKFEKSTMDISSIIALESLNSLVYFFIRMTSLLLTYLIQTETAARELLGLGPLDYDSF